MNKFLIIILFVAFCGCLHIPRNVNDSRFSEEAFVREKALSFEKQRNNPEKKRIKELKKMAIDLEMTIDEILPLALDVFIDKFNNTPLEKFEKKGVKIFFE